MSALEAVLRRRSWSKVTQDAPTREELMPLVAAAGRVADHSSLQPWRLIELRGEDRIRLGAALSEAAGERHPSTKPLRAPLLLAVVVSYRRSEKVPRWEQEAVASGVAHVLSLLLDEAGWGVIWRTGGHTRHPEVARVHGLGPTEELLGWLYVGGKPGKDPGRRRPIDAARMLSRLPETDAGDEAATANTPHEEAGVPRSAQATPAAKKAGRSSKEAKKAGRSSKEAKKAGRSSKEAKKAGRSSKEAKKAGRSAKKSKKADRASKKAKPAAAKTALTAEDDRR